MTVLVRANLLRGVHSGERESPLERCARVGERGAVDVREDDEVESESGQLGQCGDRIWEDRPVGEGGCECGRRGGMRRGATTIWERGCADGGKG